MFLEFARDAFQSADTYDRGRPGYPPEITAFVTKAAQGRKDFLAVDVGAGTGKLSDQIQQSGIPVVAIEPVHDMARILYQRLPRMPIVGGLAEQLPLRSACADIVLAAQAFHWFDGPRSLAEFHRVLKTAGFLMLIWNNWDTRRPWLASIVDRLGPFFQRGPHGGGGAWKQAFQGSKFGPLHEYQYWHSRRILLREFLDEVASISTIASLPLAEQKSALADIRTMAQPDTPSAGETGTYVTVAYRTRLYVSYKL